MATGVTDAKGNLTFSGMYPHGDYYLKEISVPDGWLLSTETYPVALTAANKSANENVIMVYLEDPILNRLIYTPVTITKKDITGAETLPGAVFGLFNARHTKVQETISGADGSVVFSQIPYGTYTIRELSAPYGYHPSEEEWTVTVDGTYVNPTTLLATVENKAAPGRIKMLKQDELDNHVIAGVQFDIFSVGADGNPGDLVATMTTGDDGIAESPDLFPADYIVREHANPTGYEDTLWSEKITVGMDEIVTRTVTNKPIQGKIRIVKTDSETGKGLPGAVFTVTRVSGLPSHGGEGDGEIVAVITTGKDGTAETPLLTWGEYTIVETSVPDDYLDGGYSVTVRIPTEMEVVERSIAEAEAIAEMEAAADAEEPAEAAELAEAEQDSETEE